MADTKNVSSIMRSVPGMVTADTAMKEAVRIMKEKKANGLLVVDEAGKIAGIISSWDVIQHIVPDYLEDDKHLAAFESEDTFSMRIQQLAETPVSQFMTKNVRTVSPDDSLMHAATVLSEARIRQLPVVDAEGNLVGYINRTDMKLAIAEILGV